MRHIIQHALLGLLIGAVLRAGLKSNSVHGQSILKNEATVTAIPHTEGSLRWHRDWMNEVFPILEEQCSHCHWSTVEAEAGLEFDKLSDAGMALENHRVLKSIVRAVVSGDMPPENPMDPGLRKKVQSMRTATDPLSEHCQGRIHPGGCPGMSYAIPSQVSLGLNQRLQSLRLSRPLWKNLWS